MSNDNYYHEIARNSIEPMVQIVANWVETAAQHHRNECYYRGLLVKCGKLIGHESYVSDDGSVQDEVLCAKIPELVEKLVKERKC
jgi:HD-like signal output (HDOD) protein